VASPPRQGRPLYRLVLKLNYGVDKQVGSIRICLVQSWFFEFYTKLSQVITLPIAKRQTRSKQNKDMHKFISEYSERKVLLPVLASVGE
jgi:hypothetical protein